MRQRYIFFNIQHPIKKIFITIHFYFVNNLDLHSNYQTIKPFSSNWLNSLMKRIVQIIFYNCSYGKHHTITDQVRTSCQSLLLVFFFHKGFRYRTRIRRTIGAEYFQRIHVLWEIFDINTDKTWCTVTPHVIKPNDSP